MPPRQTSQLRELTSDWVIRAAANEPFTFLEIEYLVGLFQWISTACPAIISSVAALQVLKHGMKRSGLQSRRLDARGRAAVVDLAAFFTSWNRTCPIFAGFSPTAQWEVIIKVDASTDFGAGGYCLPSLVNLIHEWLPDERAQALAHNDHPIRESTTFFELLGIYLLLFHFAPQIRGKRIQFECDNEAAIRDLVCCFSSKLAVSKRVSKITPGRRSAFNSGKHPARTATHCYGKPLTV